MQARGWKPAPGPRLLGVTSAEEPASPSPCHCPPPPKACPCGGVCTQRGGRAGAHRSAGGRWHSANGGDFSGAEGIWGLSCRWCTALATLPQHWGMWHLEEQGRSPGLAQAVPKACINITKAGRDQAGLSST